MTKTSYISTFVLHLRKGMMKKVMDSLISAQISAIWMITDLLYEMCLSIFTCLIQTLFLESMHLHDFYSDWMFFLSNLNPQYEWMFSHLLLQSWFLYQKFYFLKFLTRFDFPQTLRWTFSFWYSFFWTPNCQFWPNFRFSDVF